MSTEPKRPQAPKTRNSKPDGISPRLSKNAYWAVGALVLVVALIGGSFLIGGKSKVGPGVAASALPVGSTAPAFSGRDVLTGRQISASDLAGKNVLYYFSSGSSCQACMVQAQALQRDMVMLHKAHMSFVMITNDSASTLRAAANGYQLAVPMVADPQGMLTSSFGAVGGGMDMGDHMADHSFVLVDKTGTVRFHKDFPSMWITTSALLKQLPSVS
jgi:thioredoxin-dependent peroxiredoxin